MPPAQRYHELLRQARRINHDRLRSKAYDAHMRSDIVHCMLGRVSALETMVGKELRVPCCTVCAFIKYDLSCAPLYASEWTGRLRKGTRGERDSAWILFIMKQ